MSLPLRTCSRLIDKKAVYAAPLFSRLPSVCRVAYLCGGFATFQRSYPFMCTDSPLYESGRLYPSQITRAVAEDTVPRKGARRFVIEEELSFGGSLYLSSHALAAEPAVLRALGVTHVINVTPDHPDAKGESADQLRYLRIPANDSCDQDLSTYFSRASDFIDRAFAGAGATVLVHCRHGQSRSATVVAAWLMRRDPTLTSEAALSYLRECRPRVRPNEAFRKQLAGLQHQSGDDRPWG